MIVKALGAALTFALACTIAAAAHTGNGKEEDREAYLVQTPARMPWFARTSGFCCVVINRSNQSPIIESREVGRCSDEVFRRPTETAISTWMLDPSVAPDSEHPDYEHSFMRYNLNDEQGVCIEGMPAVHCKPDGTFAEEFDSESLCRSELLS